MPWTERDEAFLKAARDLEFITEEQGAECRKAYETVSATGARVTLAKLMLDRGILTAEKHTKIAAELRSRGIHPKIGPFDLLAKLGSGGSATVYKAVDTRTKTVVALKVLAPSLAADAKSVQRFLRGAELAMKVKHANVAQTFQLGREGTHQYVSMEFVQGTPLSEKAGPGRPLPGAEAHSIIRQTTEALIACHAQSIIHRDVKPANIMVTAGGTAKLLDLGLARTAESSTTDVTMTGHIVGTPYYMSPEQCASSKNIDARADVYSLGATYFYALTGRPPFDGETMYEVMQQQSSGQVPDPRQFNPDVKGQTCDLIKRMMAKTPADRPQSMEEVLAALDAPEEASPETPGEQAQDSYDIAAGAAAPQAGGADEDLGAQMQRILAEMDRQDPNENLSRAVVRRVHVIDTRLADVHRFQGDWERYAAFIQRAAARAQFSDTDEAAFTEVQQTIARDYKRVLPLLTHPSHGGKVIASCEGRMSLVSIAASAATCSAQAEGLKTGAALLRDFHEFLLYCRRQAISANALSYAWGRCSGTPVGRAALLLVGVGLLAAAGFVAMKLFAGAAQGQKQAVASTSGLALGAGRTGMSPSATVAPAATPAPSATTTVAAPVVSTTVVLPVSPVTTLAPAPAVAAAPPTTVAQPAPDAVTTISYRSASGRIMYRTVRSGGSRTTGAPAGSAESYEYVNAPKTTLPPIDPAEADRQVKEKLAQIARPAPPPAPAGAKLIIAPRADPVRLKLPSGWTLEELGFVVNAQSSTVSVSRSGKTAIARIQSYDPDAESGTFSGKVYGNSVRPYQLGGIRYEAYTLFFAFNPSDGQARFTGRLGDHEISNSYAFDDSGNVYAPVDVALSVGGGSNESKARYFVRIFADGHIEPFAPELRNDYGMSLRFNPELVSTRGAILFPGESSAQLRQPDGKVQPVSTPNSMKMALTDQGGIWYLAAGGTLHRIAPGGADETVDLGEKVESFYDGALTCNLRGDVLVCAYSKILVCTADKKVSVVAAPPGFRHITNANLDGDGNVLFSTQSALWYANPTTGQLIRVLSLSEQSTGDGIPLRGLRTSYRFVDEKGNAYLCASPRDGVYSSTVFLRLKPPADIASLPSYKPDPALSTTAATPRQETASSSAPANPPVSAPATTTPTLRANVRSTDKVAVPVSPLRQVLKGGWSVEQLVVAKKPWMGPTGLAVNGPGTKLVFTLFETQYSGNSPTMVSQIHWYDMGQRTLTALDVRSVTPPQMVGLDAAGNAYCLISEMEGDVSQRRRTGPLLYAFQPDGQATDIFPAMRERRNQPTSNMPRLFGTNGAAILPDGTVVYPAINRTVWRRAPDGQVHELDTADQTGISQVWACGDDIVCMTDRRFVFRITKDRLLPVMELPGGGAFDTIGVNGQGGLAAFLGDKAIHGYQDGKETWQHPAADGLVPPLLLDEQGNAWWSDNSGGVMRRDAASGVVEPILPQRQPIGNRLVRRVVLSRYGTDKAGCVYAQVNMSDGDCIMRFVPPKPKVSAPAPAPAAP